MQYIWWISSRIKVSLFYEKNIIWIKYGSIWYNNVINKLFWYIFGWMSWYVYRILLNLLARGWYYHIYWYYQNLTNQRICIYKYIYQLIHEWYHFWMLCFCNWDFFFNIFFRKPLFEDIINVHSYKLSRIGYRRNFTWFILWEPECIWE